MPLNIHAECRKRLNETLAEALPSIEAKNGMFIDLPSTAKLVKADLVLPQTGPLRNRLVEYIDEFPLSVFVTETIGQELYELDRYLSDQTVALIDIPEYADAPATANRLLDNFESLPWTYQVSVPLPEALTDIFQPDQDFLALSPSIRIVRPAKAFVEEYPLEHLNSKRNKPTLAGLLGAGEPTKWNTERLYIQIAGEGFIGPFGGSGTAHTIERTLRSFCGLAIATQLFKVEYTYSPSPWKTSVYVHRKSADDTWFPTTRYDLNEAISRGLDGLKLHDLDGWLDTELKRKDWVDQRIQDIAAVFRSGPRAEADQIILASQWLFDSYSGQDQLLSFVQSMVVLEIVLGDKSISDEIGIGELISNRVAYLIGTTHEERAQLLVDFKEIYKVRSQIVHSGKHKLSFAEHTLFSRLRWMCRRVIAKEVDLLKYGIGSVASTRVVRVR
jgi:Apea-like HEPN